MTTPQFSLTTESDSANIGRFILEPLPQGFGDTLGNSLRRVLYSAIPGAAITSVSLSGVTHQFATIPGVLEDTIQIILNLKQVRVTYTGDKPVKINLTAKGIKDVSASDFELPSGVTIANPGLIIAHLTDKSAKFEVSATVESGFGYSPAEDRKTTTLGVIPMDAIFTPVVKATYKVEATRVGRVTNYDKLILDIITDGTISPQEALTSSAQTLVNYFSNIVNPQTVTASSSASANSKIASGSTLSVEELDLPTRISNALQRAGFNSVSDLLSLTRTDLSKIKNLGGKSVKIVEDALIQRGFNLNS